MWGFSLYLSGEFRKVGEKSFQEFTLRRFLLDERGKEHAASGEVKKHCRRSA